LRSSALRKGWNLRILDDQQLGINNFLLARINFGICDFAIRECGHQTRHAFQSTPLCFAVHFLNLHSVQDDFVCSELSMVALSIGLASVFGEDSPLASRSIHQRLELVTLGPPHIVSMCFDPALLHLLVVISDCFLACRLVPEIPVKVTVGESASPTPSARPSAFGSMYVATADRHRYTSDIAVDTLAARFRHDGSVGFCCAKLRRQLGKLFALENFDLVQAALLRQAILFRCKFDCFI
jgi:hypothetical protein